MLGGEDPEGDLARAWGRDRRCNGRRGAKARDRERYGAQTTSTAALR
jgi:hypothetical protein